MFVSAVAKVSYVQEVRLMSNSGEPGEVIHSRVGSLHSHVTI